MNKLKSFLNGFDYGIKNYLTIEDKHFFTYHKDVSLSDSYRKGIKIARKYVQYRYEILMLTVLIFTTLLFMFTW